MSDREDVVEAAVEGGEAAAPEAQAKKAWQLFVHSNRFYDANPFVEGFGYNFELLPSVPSNLDSNTTNGLLEVVTHTIPKTDRDGNEVLRGGRKVPKDVQCLLLTHPEERTGGGLSPEAKNEYLVINECLLYEPTDPDQAEASLYDVINVLLHNLRAASHRVSSTVGEIPFVKAYLAAVKRENTLMNRENAALNNSLAAAGSEDERTATSGLGGLAEFTRQANTMAAEAKDILGKNQHRIAASAGYVWEPLVGTGGAEAWNRHCKYAAYPSDVLLLVAKALDKEFDAHSELLAHIWDQLDYPRPISENLDQIKTPELRAIYEVLEAIRQERATLAYAMQHRLALAHRYGAGYDDVVHAQLLDILKEVQPGHPYCQEPQVEADLTWVAAQHNHGLDAALLGDALYLFKPVLERCPDMFRRANHSQGLADQAVQAQFATFINTHGTGRVKRDLRQLQAQQDGLNLTLCGVDDPITIFVGTPLDLDSDIHRDFFAQFNLDDLRLLYVDIPSSATEDDIFHRVNFDALSELKVMIEGELRKIPEGPEPGDLSEISAFYKTKLILLQRRVEALTEHWQMVVNAKVNRLISEVEHDENITAIRQLGLSRFAHCWLFLKAQLRVADIESMAGRLFTIVNKEEFAREALADPSLTPADFSHVLFALYEPNELENMAMALWPSVCATDLPWNRERAAKLAHVINDIYRIHDVPKGALTGFLAPAFRGNTPEANFMLPRYGELTEQYQVRVCGFGQQIKDCLPVANQVEITENMPNAIGAFQGNSFTDPNFIAISDTLELCKNTFAPDLVTDPVALFNQKLANRDFLSQRERSNDVWLNRNVVDRFTRYCAAYVDSPASPSLISLMAIIRGDEYPANREAFKVLLLPLCENDNERAKALALQIYDSLLLPTWNSLHSDARGFMEDMAYRYAEPTPPTGVLYSVFGMGEPTPAEQDPLNLASIREHAAEQQNVAHYALVNVTGLLINRDNRVAFAEFFTGAPTATKQFTFVGAPVTFTPDQLRDALAQVLSQDNINSFDTVLANVRNYIAGQDNRARKHYDGSDNRLAFLVCRILQAGIRLVDDNEQNLNQDALVSFATQRIDWLFSDNHLAENLYNEAKRARDLAFLENLAENPSVLSAMVVQISNKNSAFILEPHALPLIQKLLASDILQPKVVAAGEPQKFPIEQVKPAVEAICVNIIGNNITEELTSEKIGVLTANPMGASVIADYIGNRFAYLYENDAAPTENDLALFRWVTRLRRNPHGATLRAILLPVLQDKPWPPMHGRMFDELIAPLCVARAPVANGVGADADVAIQAAEAELKCLAGGYAVTYQRLKGNDDAGGVGGDDIRASLDDIAAQIQVKTRELEAHMNADVFAVPKAILTKRVTYLLQNSLPFEEADLQMLRAHTGEVTIQDAIHASFAQAAYTGEVDYAPVLIEFASPLGVEKFAKARAEWLLQNDEYSAADNTFFRLGPEHLLKQGDFSSFGDIAALEDDIVAAGKSAFVFRFNPDYEHTDSRQLAGRDEPCEISYEQYETFIQALGSGDYQAALQWITAQLEALPEITEETVDGADPLLRESVRRRLEVAQAVITEKSQAIIDAKAAYSTAIRQGLNAGVSDFLETASMSTDGDAEDEHALLGLVDDGNFELIKNTRLRHDVADPSKYTLAHREQYVRACVYNRETKREFEQYFAEKFETHDATAAAFLVDDAGHIIAVDAEGNQTDTNLLFEWLVLFCSEDRKDAVFTKLASGVVKTGELNCIAQLHRAWDSANTDYIATAGEVGASAEATDSLRASHGILIDKVDALNLALPEDTSQHQYYFRTRIAKLKLLQALHGDTAPEVIREANQVLNILLQFHASDEVLLSFVTMAETLLQSTEDEYTEQWNNTFTAIIQFLSWSPGVQELYTRFAPADLARDVTLLFFKQPSAAHTDEQYEACVNFMTGYHEQDFSQNFLDDSDGEPSEVAKADHLLVQNYIQAKADFNNVGMNPATAYAVINRKTSAFLSATPTSDGNDSPILFQVREYLRQFAFRAREFFAEQFVQGLVQQVSVRTDMDGYKNSVLVPLRNFLRDNHFGSNELVAELNHWIAIQEHATALQGAYAAIDSLANLSEFDPQHALAFEVLSRGEDVVPPEVKAQFDNLLDRKLADEGLDPAVATALHCFKDILAGETDVLAELLGHSLSYLERDPLRAKFKAVADVLQGHIAKSAETTNAFDTYPALVDYFNTLHTLRARLDEADAQFGFAHKVDEFTQLTDDMAELFGEEGELPLIVRRQFITLLERLNQELLRIGGVQSKDFTNPSNDSEILFSIADNPIGIALLSLKRIVEPDTRDDARKTAKSELGAYRQFLDLQTKLDSVSAFLKGDNDDFLGLDRYLVVGNVLFDPLVTNFGFIPYPHFWQARLEEIGLFDFENADNLIALVLGDDADIHNIGSEQFRQVFNQSSIVQLLHRLGFNEDTLAPFNTFVENQYHALRLCEHLINPGEREFNLFQDINLEENLASLAPCVENRLLTQLNPLFNSLIASDDELLNLNQTAGYHGLSLALLRQLFQVYQNKLTLDDGVYRQLQVLNGLSTIREILSSPNRENVATLDSLMARITIFTTDEELQYVNSIVKNWVEDEIAAIYENPAQFDWARIEMLATLATPADAIRLHQCEEFLKWRLERVDWRKAFTAENIAIWKPLVKALVNIPDHEDSELIAELQIRADASSEHPYTTKAKFCLELIKAAYAHYLFREDKHAGYTTVNASSPVWSTGDGVISLSLSTVLGDVTLAELPVSEHAANEEVYVPPATTLDAAEVAVAASIALPASFKVLEALMTKVHSLLMLRVDYQMDKLFKHLLVDAAVEARHAAMAQMEMLKDMLVCAKMNDDEGSVQIKKRTLRLFSSLLPVNPETGEVDEKSLVLMPAEVVDIQTVALDNLMDLGSVVITSEEVTVELLEFFIAICPSCVIERVRDNGAQYTDYDFLLALLKTDYFQGLFRQFAGLGRVVDETHKVFTGKGKKYWLVGNEVDKFDKVDAEPCLDEMAMYLSIQSMIDAHLQALQVELAEASKPEDKNAAVLSCADNLKPVLEHFGITVNVVADGQSYTFDNVVRAPKFCDHLARDGQELRAKVFVPMVGGTKQDVVELAASRLGEEFAQLMFTVDGSNRVTATSSQEEAAVDKSNADREAAAARSRTQHMMNAAKFGGIPVA